MSYLRGPAVDSADMLADGRPFRNIDEFKQLLLADKDQLGRALAEKLLSYATGRAPTAIARSDLERIVENVREKHYGFRSLVHEVVQSDAFRDP
jgi:hypothetical protein